MTTRIINTTFVAFLVLNLVAAISQTATAQQIGLGAGLAAGSLDGAGTRLNIEGAFTTLPAGKYQINNFEYSASSSAGNIQPFLVELTGADTYDVLWAGPTDSAPAASGITTELFPSPSERFNLASSTDVYAGFNASSNIVFFADPDGPTTTDHNNPALFAISPGDSIGPFTNNNLPRNYAFAINVTAVPEPSGCVLGLLALGGLGMVASRRRRARR